MSIDPCLKYQSTSYVVDASAIQNTYVDSVMCVTTPPVQDGFVITVITYVSQLKRTYTCACTRIVHLYTHTYNLIGKHPDCIYTHYIAHATCSHGYRA